MRAQASDLPVFFCVFTPVSLFFILKRAYGMIKSNDKIGNIGVVII